VSLMHHPKIITSRILSQYTSVNSKNLFFLFSTGKAQWSVDSATILKQ
jgi:hypothetical protein